MRGYEKISVGELPEDLERAVDMFIRHINTEDGSIEYSYRSMINSTARIARQKGRITEKQYKAIKSYYVNGDIYAIRGRPAEIDRVKGKENPSDALTDYIENGYKIPPMREIGGTSNAIDETEKVEHGEEQYNAAILAERKRVAAALLEHNEDIDYISEVTLLSRNEIKMMQYEAAYKAAYEEGYKESVVETLIELVNDGSLTFDMAAEKAGPYLEVFMEKFVGHPVKGEVKNDFCCRE